ncbi:hypothetical protein HDE_09731 [Halotydeus destructor]|nr:hypothetical protein HDE_09731 [Halotydeus destructor]
MGSDQSKLTKQSVHENIDKMAAKSKEAVNDADKQMKGMRKDAENMADQVSGKVKGMRKDAENMADQVSGKVKERYKEVDEKFDSAISSMADNAKESVDSGIEKVRNTAEALKAKLDQNLDSVKSKTSITKEDEKNLIQCSKEAMMTRSLPAAGVGLALGFLLQMGGKKRRIWPMLFLGTAGYLGGSVVYAPTCAKRIANSSSDSDFAKGVRKTEAKIDELLKPS